MRSISGNSSKRPSLDIPDGKENTITISSLAGKDLVIGPKENAMLDSAREYLNDLRRKRGSVWGVKEQEMVGGGRPESLGLYDEEGFLRSSLMRG